MESRRQLENEASLKAAAEKEVASLKERLAEMEAHASARWVVFVFAFLCYWWLWW